MSAWYIFSALGFYPVDPVSATYVIGTYVLLVPLLLSRPAPNTLFLCMAFLALLLFSGSYVTSHRISLLSARIFAFRSHIAYSLAAPRFATPTAHSTRPAHPA